VAEKYSGAVAKMKLQHQSQLHNLQFKLKDVQIDLGAEKKVQTAVETELMEASKTVSKLRAKMDDMMVDAVKSVKSVEAMMQKVQLKQHNKQQRFNHSDAVVDRAIAKKGREKRDDNNYRRKKRGVTRDDECKSRSTFAKWLDDRASPYEYIDSGDSVGDYDAMDYLSSVSSGRQYKSKSRGNNSRYRSRSRRRILSRRLRSRSRSWRSNRKRSRSRSRSWRQSNSMRSRSTDGSHTTFDPEENSDSMVEDKDGNGNNVPPSQNDISINGTAWRDQASQPINVELSIRVSQQSIGVDNRVSK